MRRFRPVCVFLAVLTAAGAVRGAAPRPVVLLTDIGMDIDDQWGLAHLCASPRLRLLGVVTSHAANLPAPAAEATAAAARSTLRRVAPGRFIPVIAGSSLPLARREAPRSAMGASYLLAMARRHGTRDRLAVLLIGPATDLAAALLADATLADRIEVVAMGFKRWPAGGNSWNVRQDVRAWQVVIASRAPLVIGCDEVCVRDLSLTAVQAARAVAAHGAAGRWLAELLRDHLRKHGPREAQRLSGRPDAWPVWDEVVVAHLLGMTTARLSTRPPLADGQEFQPPLAEAGGGGGGRSLAWITSADAPRLWRDLGESLSAAEAGGAAARADAGVGRTIIRQAPP